MSELVWYSPSNGRGTGVRAEVSRDLDVFHPLDERGEVHDALLDVAAKRPQVAGVPEVDEAILCRGVTLPG